MPIQITVKNLQKSIPLRPTHLIQKTQKILRALRVDQADLSLVFVNDTTIRSLNKKYLQHDVATDVLAFDLREDTQNKRVCPRLSNKKSRDIIGEIIISTDRAWIQAKRYQMTYRQELLLYIIHGILHLQGYDDHGPRKTACMRVKEQELLKFIC